MKKEKKITVKFYLNRLLEGATGEKGKKYYPLYIQLTYNRRNMQLKSKYGEYYDSLDKVKKGLMDFEEKILCKIIRYESSHTEGDYDMKGLKQKYELYSTSIEEVVEHYLKPKLRLSILKTNDMLIPVINFSEPRATVDRLYMAARKLFPDIERFINVKLHEELQAYLYYKRLCPVIYLDYSFPTIIEWVEGSYKKEFETQLKRTYKNKPDIIKKVMALVADAVSKKTEKMEV